MAQRSLFWYSNFAQLCLRAVQAIIVARMAGPHNFGLYVGVIAIPAILGRVVEFGIPQALGYYTRSHPKFYHAAIRIAVRHVLLVTMPVLAFLFLLRFFPFGDADMTALAVDYWYLLAVSQLAQLVIGLVTPLAVATDSPRRYAFAVNAPPAMFILYLLLYIFLEEKIDAVGLVICDMASSATAMAGLLLLLWKRHNADAPATPVTTKAVYSYGASVFPGVVFKTLSLRLDRLILIVLLPAHALALYSVGTSLRDIAQTPANIYGVTYQNHLIDRVKKGKGYLQTMYRSIAIWSALTALMAAVFWFLAPYVIPLFYGPAFTDAAPIARVIMISVIFLTASGFGWMLMVATRHPLAISISNVSGGLIGFGLLWFMTDAYGIMGAAWATVLTTLIIAAATVAIASILKPRSDDPPKDLP